MTIRSRVAEWLKPELEKRSIGWHDVWFNRPLPSMKSGVSVTSQSAFGLGPISQAVQLLSQEFATLPLEVWRVDDDTRELARRHPAFRLLRWQANPLFTAWKWREQAMIHTLLFGNSITEIIRDASNRPIALWPLEPWKVEAFFNETLGRERDLVYRYNPIGGDSRRLFPEDVIHLRAMDLNVGLWGQSTVLRCAEVVGLTQAAQDFASLFFGSGANLSGVLEHPTSLGEDAFNSLREAWDEAHKGTGNSHSVAILEGGMTWKPTSIPPEHGQMLETREFQVNEIARIFNLPPHRIGGSADSLTYSNETQERLAFYTNSVRPWLTQMEQEIGSKLLGRNFEADFNMSEALRADQKTRYESHGLAISAGWMEKNEVRRMEGLNEIEGLDDEPEVTEGPLPLIEPEPDTEGDRSAFDALESILRSAVERVLIRQRHVLDELRNGKRAEFFEAQAEVWPLHLGPVLTGLSALGIEVPDDYGKILGDRFSVSHAADLENGVTDLVLAWDADDIVLEIYTELRGKND